MQGRPGEGRGEAEEDGRGPHGLHATLERLLGDGCGYWENILSNHRRYVPRVFQEAHWRRQVAESARRTLDTLYYIFIFISVYFCLVICCFTATRSPQGEMPLDIYLSALVLSSFLSFVLAALYNILAPDPCFARAENTCRCAVCVIDPARHRSRRGCTGLNCSYAMINSSFPVHVVFKASLMYRSGSNLLLDLFLIFQHGAGQVFQPHASRRWSMVQVSGLRHKERTTHVSFMVHVHHLRVHFFLCAIPRDQTDCSHVKSAFSVIYE